eukprot:3292367-Rhodomonas_salina.1
MEVADQEPPGSLLNPTANGSTAVAGEGGNSGGMEVDDDSELTSNSMVEEGGGGERQSMQPSTPSLAVPAALTVTPPVAAATPETPDSNQLTRAEEHGAETEDEAPP